MKKPEWLDNQPRADILASLRDPPLAGRSVRRLPPAWPRGSARYGAG
ncbi:hypothetical protein DFP87_101547 [Achromobacter marplatensis]|uniref:ArsR family transcriptional regulator n=1 Tax=Achromobacter marplatensis TaxID=470868 RepID=A0ABX9GLA9_9BURK|nr:hypothetical protein DFP87_101547 [Achromobacter marplatensis]CAB3628772.1 hypothetical protein LMG26219_00759 [Achromobacter marplatensis]